MKGRKVFLWVKGSEMEKSEQFRDDEKQNERVLHSCDWKADHLVSGSGVYRNHCPWLYFQTESNVAHKS